MTDNLLVVVVVLMQHLNFLWAPARVVVTNSQLCHAYYQTAHNTTWVKLTAFLLRKDDSSFYWLLRLYLRWRDDCQNIDNFIISGWSHSAGLQRRILRWRPERWRAGWTGGVQQQLCVCGGRDQDRKIIHSVQTIQEEGKYCQTWSAVLIIVIGLVEVEGWGCCCQPVLLAAF